MKKLIILLVCVGCGLVINGLYLEYCVSRPINDVLQIIATCGVVLIDILIFVIVVKTLKNTLKI